MAPNTRLGEVLRDDSPLMVEPAIGQSRGVAYVAALLVVCVLALGYSSAAAIWSTTALRFKEQQLLFVGDQFRQAIERYYESSPGTVKRYPMELEDLLYDKRKLVTNRYLRKIFLDPMTHEAKWGLVRAPDGGVMGVFSLSQRSPFKTSNFPQHYQHFNSAGHYGDWIFIYVPPVQVSSAIDR